MKFVKSREICLDYSDVFIVPRLSFIESRKTVDVSTKLFDRKLDVPVISANMDTVTNSEVAIQMFENGGFGALHRFLSIENNVNEYNAVRLGQADCLVSIGVNEESKERAKALFDVGARYFVIDIAHGHSSLMKNMIAWLRKEFDNKIYIMAGNVATYEGSYDLAAWGADAVKVGIGPGSVCITKNQTGVTFPQFEAVVQSVSGAKYYENETGKAVSIVADGGLREYGDIAKAIGAGANLVMSGKFFANTKEAPGKRIYSEAGDVIAKEYRGMASKEAMKSIKREEDMATPEGIQTMIKSSEHGIKDVLKDIKGALQSSFSYTNATNMEEFQKRIAFGIRN